jgi:hypothetical protein
MLFRYRIPDISDKSLFMMLEAAFYEVFGIQATKSDSAICLKLK